MSCTRLLILLPLALAACSDGGSNATLAPAPTDEAPTIAAVSDQLVPANESTGAISIEIDDDVTAVADLELSAQSNNPALVMADGLRFEGSGSDRSLIITPTPGQTGEATITVTVTDSQAQSSDTAFLLTVTPQLVSLDSFVRGVFAAGENTQPQSINDKDFTDDATDFDDLVAR